MEVPVGDRDVPGEGAPGGWGRPPHGPRVPGATRRAGRSGRARGGERSRGARAGHRTPRVDASAQVGGEPVEGDWPGCRGAVPEAGLVKLDGLEPGRRQPGEDRSPDVLIIEKAVHEHEGPAAVAVTTEHEVTVRDGCCGGHAVSLPVKRLPVRMSDLSLLVLLLSTVCARSSTPSAGMGDPAWYAAMSSTASW